MANPILPPSRNAPPPPPPPRRLLTPELVPVVPPYEPPTVDEERRDSAREAVRRHMAELAQETSQSSSENGTPVPRALPAAVAEGKVMLPGMQLAAREAEAARLEELAYLAADEHVAPSAPISVPTDVERPASSDNSEEDAIMQMFSLGESGNTIRPILLGTALYSKLTGRIRGQEPAMKSFSAVILRSERARINKKGRPKGSFLFLGPTGTGKTETVKTGTTLIYDDDVDKHFQRFDMAEYQSDNALELMLGRNMEEQGHLGDAIDRLNSQGGGFILFDEIEKGHPQFKTAFLGATDDARITMANGDTKDLSWIYLVFTSNLGSAQAIQMENVPYATMERHVKAAAASHFRPEVLARFNEVIVYNKLTTEVQFQICVDNARHEVAHLADSIKNETGGLPIEISPVNGDVLRYLRLKGYSKFAGARPMRDAIERAMGNALSDWLGNPRNTYLGLLQSLPPRGLHFIVRGDGLALVTHPLEPATDGR